LTFFLPNTVKMVVQNSHAGGGVLTDNLDYGIERMSTPSAAYEWEPRMAEPHFLEDDDLPKTVLRERDARERELRHREQRDRERTAREAGPAREAAAPYDAPGFMRRDPPAGRPRPVPFAGSGIVERLQIPFAHLAWFFIKATFAAIPAILLLGLLLWAGGKGLATAFPDLSRMQILIHFPK
jgi:hypothetical protein